MVLLGGAGYCNPTPVGNAAGVVVIPARQHTKESAFTHAIAPNDTDLFAVIHTQRHVMHQLLARNALFGNVDIGNHSTIIPLRHLVGRKQ